jgi:hypothetical protein
LPGTREFDSSYVSRTVNLTILAPDIGVERTLWLAEGMFFLLPLGHSDVLALHDRALPYVAQIVEQAPEHQTKSMPSLRTRHAPTARL